MQITLGVGEVAAGVAVGIARHQAALAAGFTDPRAVTAAVKRNHWASHIEGALGELAACKALGVYWPASCNTLKHVADIPPNIEVRTRSGGRGPLDSSLILRDNDPNDRIYVLVVGVCPVYTVVGWIQAANGKRPEWAQDPNGWGSAYFVPPDQLAPCDPAAIRAWVHAHYTPT